jgi:hypothetical protein
MLDTVTGHLHFLETFIGLRKYKVVKYDLI